MSIADKTFIKVLVFVVCCVLLWVGFSRITTDLKRVGNMPTIDLWKMTNSYHEYGYWSQASDAFKKKLPPEKVVRLSLEEGNYPGAPDTTKFQEWIEDCLQDVKLFTTKEYEKRFTEN